MSSKPLTPQSTIASLVKDMWNSFWTAYPSVLSGWFGRTIQSNRLYSLVQQTQQAQFLRFRFRVSGLGFRV